MARKREDNEKFWMVLVEGAEAPPKVKQCSIASAIFQARRFAAELKKQTYVLECKFSFDWMDEEIKGFKTNKIHVKVKGPAQPPKGTVPNPPKVVKQPKHQVQSQPKPEMAAAPKKPKPEKVKMAKPEPSPKENKAPVVIVKKRRIAAMPEEIA